MDYRLVEKTLCCVTGHDARTALAALEKRFRTANVKARHLDFPVAGDASLLEETDGVLGHVGLGRECEAGQSYESRNENCHLTLEQA